MKLAFLVKIRIPSINKAIAYFNQLASPKAVLEDLKIFRNEFDKIYEIVKTKSTGLAEPVSFMLLSDEENFLKAELHNQLKTLNLIHNNKTPIHATDKINKNTLLTIPGNDIEKYIQNNYKNINKHENHKYITTNYDLNIFFRRLLDFGYFRIKAEVLDYTKALLAKIQQERYNIETLLATEKDFIQQAQQYIINGLHEVKIINIDYAFKPIHETITENQNSDHLGYYLKICEYSIQLIEELESLYKAELTITKDKKFRLKKVHYFEIKDEFKDKGNKKHEVSITIKGKSGVILVEKDFLVNDEEYEVLRKSMIQWQLVMIKYKMAFDRSIVIQGYKLIRDEFVFKQNDPSDKDDYNYLILNDIEWDLSQP
jgi:hypothetical protein